MENKQRKEMLAAFSEALPCGAQKRVAEKAGVTVAAVSSFLSGRVCG
jgi:hypothetical protein